MLPLKKQNALLRLWPYLKPHFAILAASLLLSIPLAAIKVGPAPALKYLTDTILIQKDEKALLLFPFGLIALFALNFVVRFFHYYFIRATATRVVQKLRNDLYAHLMGLSLNFFSDAQGGALLSRVMNDVQIVVQGISNMINLVREPIVFAGLLGYAFYLNWKLTLLTLVITPLMAILFGNTGKHAKRYTTKIQTNMSELSSLLSESFAGIRVIQAFGLEGFMRGQFMQKNRELSRTSLKAIRLQEMSHPAVEFISSLAIAIVLYYGGREVLKGHMSQGDIFAFFACFGLMLQPLRVFNELNISFHQCASAAESLFEILDKVTEIKDKPDAKILPPFSNNIQFDRVSFAYRSDTKILNDFSLEIKKGEIIALVGPSGAGKTTLLSLLPRFFDCQAGAIKIDGHDLRDVKIASLRSQIALVTQEVFLFHDTLRANIRAGQHQVSEQKLIEAAKAAQAWDFIQKLPQGLDTVIGDRGQKLSGGERQRVSIARAILADAPILLLDEATSSLDSENERLVQEALDRLMEGRTAIVVAHRLSTIRKASRILVLEKGKILEEGNHEDLLALRGAYAKALQLQGGFSS
jgi:ATP-binding cassette, subfamily B, bacterial MsbA